MRKNKYIQVSSSPSASFPLGDFLFYTQINFGFLRKKKFYTQVHKVSIYINTSINLYQNKGRCSLI